MIQTYSSGTEQVRQDGTPWPFLIINGDGDGLAADSASELVDELLPGHAEASPAERFSLRLSLLTDLAEQQQHAATKALLEVDSDAVEVMGEFGLTALTAPKAGTPLAFEEWPFEVPLFLIATQYVPYSATVPPAGEYVVFLNPENERTTLDALNALGRITFLVHPEALQTDAAA